MDELTFDDLAALITAVGHDQYMKQVISLFTSSQATQEQWEAMAQALRWAHPLPSHLASEDAQLINHFRRRWATTAQWKTMAQAVLQVSESGEGAVVACIDRAVVAAVVRRQEENRV